MLNNEGGLVGRKGPPYNIMNYMRYGICLKMWFVLGAICLMSCSGGNDSLADTNIEKAVSYTHLDVYKRQELEK